MIQETKYYRHLNKLKTYDLEQINSSPCTTDLTQKILPQINTILKLKPINEEIQTTNNGTYREICIDFFKYIERAQADPESKERARKFVFKTITNESNKVYTNERGTNLKVATSVFLWSLIIMFTNTAAGINTNTETTTKLNSNWTFNKNIEVTNLNPFEKPGTLTGYLFAKSKNLDEFLNSWANANVINPNTATKIVDIMKWRLSQMGVGKRSELKNLNKADVAKVITTLSIAQTTETSDLWGRFTQSLATDNIPTITTDKQKFLSQLYKKPEFKKVVTYNNGKYTLTIPSVKQSVNENTLDWIAGIRTSCILLLTGSLGHLYNKNRPVRNPRKTGLSFFQTFINTGESLANRLSLNRLIRRPVVNIENIDGIKSIKTRAKALIDLVVSKKNVLPREDQNKTSLLNEVNEFISKPDNKSYTEVFWEHFNNKNPSELSNNSLFIMMIKELKDQNSRILEPFVIALISNLSQKEYFKLMFATFLEVDEENQILKNAYQTTDSCIKATIQKIQNELNKT